ncbi:hypothetical protein KIN20_029275 [Parelaphostrongylus tenuis]|uniref:Uncharacterized protein n=1 Tax=Parelaphostrongylus tenuis TaxID=148309 RepID=A0AAD5WFF2_PARTN|nr:hypothetical protein KIN20_029275 [Parelaphostrongylus tenuis]
MPTKADSDDVDDHQVGEPYLSLLTVRFRSYRNLFANEKQEELKPNSRGGRAW